MKQTQIRPFDYIDGKKYFVAGARSAWDTVKVGLYENYEDAARNWPEHKDKRFIREATQAEIAQFFDLK